jgi:crotonobetainyl-CoA:carnitine CoA-transferase CaiB-like acyl-CoA transferase
MEEQSGALPLSGLRVLDVGTLFAGPMVATILADYGADVIKIEHPSGDSLRTLGWEKDGVSLWWLFCSRNKRCVSLNLSTPDGQEILKDLVVGADVLVESFRPGTMERWGLGWETLSEINPTLVMVRTTGFGQNGPYADRPGYGTLAEAMSGFAHMNGHPDGPPTLPPFALGDGVAAMTGAAATMIALYARDTGESRKGQVIDLSIFEPLFWIMGPQALVYDQLGIVQGRTGNRAPFTSPRNVYQSRDAVWLALSASSQSVANRVAHLVGRGDLLDEEWFQTHDGRLQHQDLLDELIGDWIKQRDASEVIEEFEQAQAAISPILSIADIFEDPQYAARSTIVSVDHPDLGPVRMQGIVPRLAATPGRVRTLGAKLGEHNHEIFCGELGMSDESLAALAEQGVI